MCDPLGKEALIDELSHDFSAHALLFATLKFCAVCLRSDPRTTNNKSTQKEYSAYLPDLSADMIEQKRHSWDGRNESGIYRAVIGIALSIA